jgi:hypothetical protein
MSYFDGTPFDYMIDPPGEEGERNEYGEPTLRPVDLVAPGEALLRLTDAEGEETDSTLSSFLEANADSRSADELADVAALSVGEFRLFGGGSVPSVIVSRVR